MLSTKQTMWRANRTGEPKRRHMLKEILPLEVPLSLDIEASSRCCLKCRYCPQSLSDAKKKELNLCTGGGQMDMLLFRKIVEQCKEFPHPLKNIRFAGFGEPLLHPEIDQMVRIVKTEGIAETVTIFTNGVALTHDLSERLVRAGVDTFLIDIQGMSDADYENVANVKIDFKKLYENVKYLANLPNRGRMFIKIFKFAIEKRESQFFQLFDEYCDGICIENIYEICPEVDYGGMVTAEKEDCGIDFSASKFCPYPWYQMSINAIGEVTACCQMLSKNSPFLRLGHLGEGDALSELWTGEKMNFVRKSLLHGHSSISPCDGCRALEVLPQEDKIDEVREKLLECCNNS